ncbi:putative Zn-binding protein involved in type VI secretion [Buttiauxella sp. BIGb0471]|uniref:PAAR domain-containing protein n=1 Tax=Buttiauxella sp. BIGb0471 TaxID=2940597 RepID=UPI002169C459|nr:PAAR domain-containing protein [Buttiauxella sp. BIGb0471]MCS3603658.1 putative Zn-binding protein involved in type VI secretion [Buttiauxella sp. BIGb0471]
MARPAARQSLDKAAHSGPINTGSHNVTIGGLPAARQGDTFICLLHGPGNIVAGSKSVTINGVPAARMGDITRCKVESLPPVKGKKTSISHFLTPVKNANQDGTVKTQKPDNIALRIFSIYSTQSDESDNNSFDQVKTGISITDFQIKDHIGDFDINLGGSVGKLEGTAGLNDKEGEYGAGAKGRATGISGNAGVSSGKENSGDYAGAKSEGSVGYGDAKIEGNVIYKPEDEKYGFGFDIGAEAAVAHGELEGSYENKYFAIKATLGGSAGSVGAGGGFSISYDSDDRVLEVRITGELALLLGLKSDLAVRGGDYDSPEEKSKKLSGVVLTGISTVVIGG